MKQIIAFLLLLSCSAASAQISSSGGQVYLRANDAASYFEPTIYVVPTYNDIRETVYLRCFVADIDKNEQAEFTILAAKEDVDAFTGAGATDVAKFFDACLQYVKDYLENIPENSGITFSL